MIKKHWFAFWCFSGRPRPQGVVHREASPRSEYFSLVNNKRGWAKATAYGRGRLLRKRNVCGFTLLEIMIAMTLIGLVVSMVFYSWCYITRHTVSIQHGSAFQAEAYRMVQSVSTEIRKSPEIISVKSDGIRFMSSNGTDTVDYEYVNDKLYRNNIPVSYISPYTFMNRFLIGMEHDYGSSGNTFSLLTITMGMNDSYGDTSLLSVKVRVDFQDNSYF
jgi:prepilin-type N-terminal cleavage/methylation domain-containing protein